MTIVDDVIDRLEHPNPDWYRDAPCRGLPASMFWLEKGQPKPKVCEGCHRAADCLTAAIVNHETEGIWGGVAIRARLRTAREVRARRPDLLAPPAAPAPVERRKSPGGREHGTDTGYGQHRRAGEVPCILCRLAHNAYTREQKRSARPRDVA